MSIEQCPVMKARAKEKKNKESPTSSTNNNNNLVVLSSGTTNRDWWPQNLYTAIQRLSQHNDKTNPFVFSEKNYNNYRYNFKHKLDYYALKKDIQKLLTNSQSWWPADYGHYGPFFIRMAWHSAGTYRIQDGRGGAGTGQLRFAPLNSWPDNGNLDKARRLLWPIKQKYGLNISWADLMILAGNVALEDMGFPTYGFAGGREDVWEPEEDGVWGQEKEWFGNKERYHNGCEIDTAKSQSLQSPLGAVQMGLIYVNPEGPNGNPSPLLSALDIRETFKRMAMNDEETVALIAGGHTFGKCHGAADAEKYVGKEPEGASLEQMGFGWNNTYKSGMGQHTITSGLEGAWTPSSPTLWDHSYLTTLWEINDWILTKSPAGAQQWIPKNYNGSSDKAPIMLTSDLALKYDPIYKKISYRYYKNFNVFQLAFAKAWYKLTHRDLGPYERGLGPEVPIQPQLWQDPITTTSTTTTLSSSDIHSIKSMIKNRIPSMGGRIELAWASASTFRKTDKRGGANGGRIRLQPQISWSCNNHGNLSNGKLQYYLKIYERIQNDIGKKTKISIADLIILGGCCALEEACSERQVPFLPGRRDAIQSDVDVESFAVLEPKADGFRNYYGYPDDNSSKEEFWLIEKAFMLNLTASEMTVLIGGLRVLGVGGSCTFTSTPGKLTNDYFVNLLSMNTIWKKEKNHHNGNKYVYNGYDRLSGKLRWKSATRCDILFGSHSILRAYAEIYAQDETLFITEFIRTYTKVMNLDRFDIYEEHNNNDSSYLRSRL